LKPKNESDVAQFIKMLIDHRGNYSILAEGI
jgi:hypothetical protein